MSAPVRSPRGRRCEPPRGRPLRRAAMRAIRARAPSRGSSTCSPRRERWGGGTASGRSSDARSRCCDGGDGVVEFLLEDVGPGTSRLCELEAGDGVLVVGPLGRGFSEPPADALLVGGGIGVAPLLAVQERWGGTALLGFRDARPRRGGRALRRPAIATDDGYGGHHGLVTELLDAELERARARLRVRAAGDAGGDPRTRRRPACRPRSRSRRRWPAGSAPATAASSRPSTATAAPASTGRCSTRRCSRDRVLRPARCATR